VFCLALANRISTENRASLPIPIDHVNVIELSDYILDFILNSTISNTRNFSISTLNFYKKVREIFFFNNFLSFLKRRIKIYDAAFTHDV